MELSERIYYTVEEVAERWNKPVDDLWHLAAAGKFILSIWYKGYCFEEDFEWTHEPDYHNECVIDDGYDRPANLSYDATALNGIIDITKETAVEFVALPSKEYVNTSYLAIDNKPRLVALRGSTESLPCSEIRECFIPKALKITKMMVIVALKEVKRMEEKHPELLSKAPELRNNLTDEPTVVPREEEKPLRTLKLIADHCGVNVDTVKDWRKKYKDFPASPVGQGTVTAFKSQLNAWMARNIRK